MQAKKLQDRRVRFQLERMNDHDSTKTSRASSPPPSCTTVSSAHLKATTAKMTVSSSFERFGVMPASSRSPPSAAIDCPPFYVSLVGTGHKNEPTKRAKQLAAKMKERRER